MFSKNKNTRSKNTPTVVPVKPAAPSIISVDLKIEGNLNSDGEIQVDGSVRGDITTKKLLVGDTADIRGQIFADSIHVYGKIEGQIKSREVVLAKTAHVVGDILHENLSIEPGAFLEGLCKRISEADLAESVKTSAVQSDLNSPSTGDPDFKKGANQAYRAQGLSGN